VYRGRTECPLLVEAMPWNWVPLVRKITRALPLVKTLVPDPGFPLQLVHHDDVAPAIALAAVTSAPAGAYNIAGDGVISMSEVVTALGADRCGCRQSSRHWLSRFWRDSHRCRPPRSGFMSRESQDSVGLDTELHLSRSLGGAGRLMGMQRAWSYHRMIPVRRGSDRQPRDAPGVTRALHRVLASTAKNAAHKLDSGGHEQLRSRPELCRRRSYALQVWAMLLGPADDGIFSSHD
jgi:hypothetical protein